MITYTPNLYRYNHVWLVLSRVRRWVQLKQVPGLTEGELRAVVRTDPVAMRVAVGRLLEIGMVAKAR